ncbi:CBN-STR-48 protein [Caenorhabditis brenneri]|uniref:CBN-STR-48 protein n=1 Tax=Caenorhabditis brenneri TaxID=135651 RepID=G0P4C8_CAEBE|nr:CBN-STR-48 protein [Caenorhabditis brenneri]
MARFYEITETFIKFGFVTVSITNSILILLTVFHIKRIIGTYKKMIITVALMGIMFSAIELIARPFVHNYNKGWMFFSLNTWLGASQLFLQISLAVYASFYLSMISFISVQFLFRYFTLTNPKIAKKFGGTGIIVWIIYPIVSGSFYGGPLFLFGMPDEYADEYFRKEILESYGLSIKDVPRFSIIAYGADGSLRPGAYFIITGALVMIIQYTIIIYCGVRMHLVMSRKFKNSSVPNKKLQKQFFRALVTQTIAPTILFVFPAAYVLLSPLLNIEMNFQTGWIYAALSLFPPIDSIALMCMVSEYRNVLKEQCKYLCCWTTERTVEQNHELRSST